MARRRGSEAGQSRRRRDRSCRECPQPCKKNFHYVLSCIGKRTRVVAAKSRQFTAEETGKGQFLRGNRRNLAGKEFVRKISSPQRVASVPHLCKFEPSGQGTLIKGSVTPDLASESASSLPVSPAWPGTHWKLRATQEERESKRFLFLVSIAGTQAWTMNISKENNMPPLLCQTISVRPVPRFIDFPLPR